jgi:enoyl-CoA hydratase
MSSVMTSKNNHVAVITFSDEKGMNVLCSDIIRGLEIELDKVAQDKDVYCLILTGAGEKAFAAGADVSQMNGFDEPSIREYISAGSKLFRKIELMDIPVIAAVKGYALGGGCELACACDIRLASDTAVFGQPEVSLGIIPGFGGTQRLARITGMGRAKEIIFSGRNVKSDEALAIGLVNKVVPKDQLLAEAAVLAEMIAKKGPIAVRMAKKAINAGMIGGLDSALEYEDELFYQCFASEDRKNAMQAFLEKRPFNEFKNR